MAHRVNLVVLDMCKTVMNNILCIISMLESRNVFHTSESLYVHFSQPARNKNLMDIQNNLGIKKKTLTRLNKLKTIMVEMLTKNSHQYAKRNIYFVRGKELANVGEFKYRFIGVRNKGELLKWRCTKNDCTATIYSGQKKKYPGESISIQLLKLIRHELLHNTELTSIVHNDLKTVRKAMYDDEEKHFLKYLGPRRHIFAVTLN
ncbi:E3 SUMO-protein ligase KIAA1586-like [Aphis craccivora]|uniref:E3 SUMO-protein ligase KIAA1586-like n=1 Tax=Aphis craccivora TaxID=307492 RepID=A0A6G0YGV4_APHCR|nr:E3 SUMO-protein ligase KIAA1586-like [Aphis craccivora]